VSGAVCGKGDSPWKTVIMPPPTIRGTREEIDVKSKSVESPVGRMLQIQKVARDRVFSARSSPVGLPCRDFEDAVGESAEMLIWRRERYLWGSDDNHKAVRPAQWVKRGALLPEPLLFKNLFGDLLITPFGNGFLREEAEVNTSSASSNSAKLAGLFVLTPQIETFRHLLLSCG
jgi:hypothetical protein